MNFLRFQVVVFAIGFLLQAVLVVNSQDFSQVTIKTIKVTDRLYMLVGSGGNIAVSVGEDGVYIVDDQYAPLNEKIRKAIAEISDQPVRFVINTHWHGDHTGGNELFGKSGAVIIAQNNVRQRLKTGQDMPAFNRTIPPAPDPSLPVITYQDALTVHLNGESAELKHFPNAHTDGDSIVYWPKSNVIHTGDLFFNGLYPFIDSSSGGSIHCMIAAADAILKMCDDDTKLIPGHGPLGNPAEYREFRDMLVKVRDRIAAARKANKKVDDWIAENPLADLEAKWGGGFLNTERFIKVVWSGM